MSDEATETLGQSLPPPRGDDRRERPTRMVSRYLFFGRRRAGRRTEETDRIYVDRPGGWIVAAFVIVVGLSILDAAFTLYLLKRGASEANPVMRAALHLGDHAFVLIKTSVTVLAAGFLMLHKTWPLGRICLAIALLGYSALTIYHLHAQQMIWSLQV